jgi:cell division protein ZapA
MAGCVNMNSSHSGTNSVRVTIFNRPYTLRTSGNPEEIEELARMVDSLMEDIASQAGTLDGVRVAVLACLHLADRLHAIEKELAGLKQRIDQKSEQFSLLLEQAIGEGEQTPSSAEVKNGPVNH